MTRSWHALFTKEYWFQIRWRQVPDSKKFVDIELDASRKTPKRIDSGISFRVKGLEACPDTPRLESDIFLMLDFEDGSCIKSLDYRTFSHWEAMEGLLLDMEKDGIALGGLWDETEKMWICRGDWDARVRPGWDVHVLCQNVQTMLEARRFEDLAESEDFESDDEHWIDEVLDQYQEEWCLPRWRIKVEQERSISKPMQDPSWIMVALGCASIVLFIAAVVVYTV